MVWGTFFGDEVPHSARLSVGRGVQKLFGQCPHAFCTFEWGFPEIQVTHICRAQKDLLHVKTVDIIKVIWHNGCYHLAQHWLWAVQSISARVVIDRSLLPDRLGLAPHESAD